MSPALPLAWIAGSVVIAAVAAVPAAAALRPGTGLAIAAGLLMTPYGLRRDVPASTACLAVRHPSRTLTLSSMPRRADTPNGLNSWLIVNATSWAREHGYTRLSLNFSPFAGLLGAKTELPPAQRLGCSALLKLKSALSLQLDNLLRFNQQFCPGLVAPRYRRQLG